MSRKITKLLCPRGHVVGTVCADDDGLYVDYLIVTGSLATPQELARGREYGIIGTPHRLREAIGSEAWCRQCRRPLPLSGGEALRAGREGVGVLRLSYESLYDNPMGVLNRDA